MYLCCSLNFANMTEPESNSTLFKGVDTGGLWGIQPPCPSQSLGLMGLEYLESIYTYIYALMHFFDTNTLLSSQPPTGWFAVVKIKVACWNCYVLNYEIINSDFSVSFALTHENMQWCSSYREMLFTTCVLSLSPEVCDHHADVVLYPDYFSPSRKCSQGTG